MKTLLTLSATLFLSLSAQGAPSVLKEIGGSGDWKASQISDHALWRKDACVAFTSGNEGSTLEVYAEKLDTAEAFGQPTIQVVVATREPFVRATIEDENKRVLLHLVLAATNEPTPLFGLISRIDDRAKLIDMLKDANRATVTLVNEKNKVVGKEKFSLRGSTKTIDLAFRDCGLELK